MVMAVPLGYGAPLELGFCSCPVGFSKNRPIWPFNGPCGHLLPFGYVWSKVNEKSLLRQFWRSFSSRSGLSRIAHKKATPFTGVAFSLLNFRVEFTFFDKNTHSNFCSAYFKLSQHNYLLSNPFHSGYSF